MSSRTGICLENGQLICEKRKSRRHNTMSNERTTPQVYNIKDTTRPKDCVYIGRPSVYGNPFIIGKDGSRLDVIKKYEQYLANNSKLTETIKNNLRGKNLVCFCKPLECHGDILLKIANQ